MSVTYLDIRNGAVEQFKQRFAPRRIHVAAHPGTFNEEEIRRLVTRTPAILTSLMRISDRDTNDESFGDFVSWVLYRANNQDLLYDGALKIVSALIPVIRNLDTAGCINGGRGIEAECLYSGSMDKINVTLWAVKWRWHLRGTVFDEATGEGEILLPGDLEYFEGYDAEHVVDRQQARDTVNLKHEGVNDGHTDDANP
ncbi:MAG: hypothetical protein LBC31_11650 [Treponema sp.]|jgi:hypothetical protein|nr:hypothetical protein [Treponema sp.]